jgi:prepilin signal peptidase PulO-like enzyme (type II secretory pathway)
MIDIWFLIRFLFGLAAGSFLNVVALRYNPDRGLFEIQPLRGRSHCHECGETLRAYELIPVISFLLQLGRCRSCKRRISFQYPVVELASAFALAFIPSAVQHTIFPGFLPGFGGSVTAYVLMASVFSLASLLFILIAAIDVRLRIIPDEANIAIALLGILGTALFAYYGFFNDFNGSFLGHYAGIFGFHADPWVNRFFGAGVGAGFFGAIVFMTRGRGMGLGDVKLAAAGGFLLGWPDAPLAFLLAFVLGAFWSIILMASGKKKMKSVIPFGPFMVLGMFLIMLFGGELMSAYFSFFP